MTTMFFQAQIAVLGGFPYSQRTDGRTYGLTLL